MALNRTRQQAFEGINPLSIGGIIELFDAERWWEGDWTLMEFVDLMLDLDDARTQFITDRTPKKPGKH